ncbi:MAG TPA: cysteine desulfurase family protein, partial [Oscillatoriaceae cyanobacterium]
RHLVTTAVEHPATLETCEALRAEGYEVTVLPVDRHGRVDPTMFGAVLRPDTILASVIHANNEIGTLQPIAELGRLAKTHGVLLHVDAAQSFGKVPIDVEALGVDLLSISGHKIYAPKGVGALYVRKRNPRVSLAAQIHGGGQERGLRSGTLNVPGIVGLGKAAEVAQSALMEEGLRLLALRDRLNRAITENLEGVALNGHPTERVPGNLNLSFARMDGEALVAALGDLAVSSASACHGATRAPSHVLRACGVEDSLALATLRFGLGRFTTEAEIDAAAERVVEAVRRLRAEAPLMMEK